MLEFLQVFLPIIIYILLIVVLIIAVIIGLKISTLLDKFNHVTDSLSDKVDSLNGIFHVIDFATDRLNDITTKAVEYIAASVTKLVSKKNKKIKVEKIKEEEK